jgi:hypothetical protein
MLPREMAKSFCWMASNRLSFALARAHSVTGRNADINSDTKTAKNRHTRARYTFENKHDQAGKRTLNVC